MHRPPRGRWTAQRPLREAARRGRLRLGGAGARTAALASAVCGEMASALPRGAPGGDHRGGRNGRGVPRGARQPRPWRGRTDASRDGRRCNW